MNANIDSLNQEYALLNHLICGNALTTQEGPKSFDGALGRIFINSTGSCVIKGNGLGGSIIASKQPSISTKPWTTQNLPL